jgi:hypothetical protein
MLLSGGFLRMLGENGENRSENEKKMLKLLALKVHSM